VFEIVGEMLRTSGLLRQNVAAIVSRGGSHFYVVSFGWFTFRLFTL